MKKRTFGIELEVSTKQSRSFVESRLSEAGIKNWSVKYDGSINGWEIVSPPLEYTQENLDEVQKVVQVLRTEVKARATKKCGMHVHHDIKDFSVKQLHRLFELYYRYQKNAMKCFIDPTRYNNYYCSLIGSGTLFQISTLQSVTAAANTQSTRYKALNIKSFVKYGTIEFRHHQASTDWLQTLCWLEITKAMVELAADESKEIPSNETPTNNGEALNKMIEELGLENNQLVKKSTARSYKFRLKAGDAS